LPVRHMCKISSPIILPVPFLRYRMDDRELRRRSRQFWQRHRPTWCFIRDYDPGLWADAWETLLEINSHRWTDEGAIVRGLPTMRDASTQARTMRVHNRGTQTSPVSGRDAGTVRVHERSTQTSPTPGRDAGIQAGEMVREASPVRALPTPGGCWNCGSTQHGYSSCGRPRRESFCFGCGERGVTVRTCRRCGPVYERTRPFTAPRGPRDRLQPE